MIIIIIMTSSFFIIRSPVNLAPNVNLQPIIFVEVSLHYSLTNQHISEIPSMFNEL